MMVAVNYKLEQLRDYFFSFAASSFERNLFILVPQVGHTPFAIVRPLLAVVRVISFISRDVLHFTQ
jgi:hypothetical protein